MIPADGWFSCECVYDATTANKDIERQDAKDMSFNRLINQFHVKPSRIQNVYYTHKDEGRYSSITCKAFIIFKRLPQRHH